MPWYRSLPAIVKTLWPALHRQQAATLALLVELILRQRSLCLADLARGSFTPQDFATRYQQLWRWTQNERIDSRHLRRALAQPALAWRAGHGQYLPIIYHRLSPVSHPPGRAAPPSAGLPAPLAQLSAWHHARAGYGL